MNHLGLRTEVLNFLTGIALVASGFVNFYAGNFEMGMSWVIFGAMYLIMGDYIQNPNLRTFFENVTDFSRVIFSWVGFIGSVVLLAYYILEFL